ncbi:MAG: carboxymuconolactone decarboxylase family protein [Acidimicrobiales bacterium]
MRHTAHGGRMTPPRIAPLRPDERDDQVRELLAGVKVGGEDANIFATLARHPGLMRRWLPFGGKLFAGKLGARERELLILRTGWNCRAEYEWAQHVPMGLAAGLTEAEISRIPAGADAVGWEPFDEVLLRAADELHADFRISDATWAALAARYDDAQLIELPMLVGQYHLVAMTLNSLGVEMDEGLEGFPDQART